MFIGYLVLLYFLSIILSIFVHTEGNFTFVHWIKLTPSTKVHKNYAEASSLIAWVILLADKNFQRMFWSLCSRFSLIKYLYDSNQLLQMFQQWGWRFKWIFRNSDFWYFLMTNSTSSLFIFCHFPTTSTNPEGHVSLACESFIHNPFFKVLRYIISRHDTLTDISYVEVCH